MKLFKHFSNIYSQKMLSFGGFHLSHLPKLLFKQHSLYKIQSREHTAEIETLYSGNSFPLLSRTSDFFVLLAKFHCMTKTLPAVRPLCSNLT